MYFRYTSGKVLNLIDRGYALKSEGAKSELAMLDAADQVVEKTVYLDDIALVNPRAYPRYDVPARGAAESSGDGFVVGEEEEEEDNFV